MVIQPISLLDLIGRVSFKNELSFKKILEKICVLICSYFSIASELRLLGLNHTQESEFLTSKD